MNFLSIAKALLPKNSPLLSKVDQAQQLAGRFSQDKNGVLELMRQYDIGQERLQQAVAALNNPKISGFLNMVQPGLPDKLRSAAREIAADVPAQGGASTPQLPQSGGSDIDALRNRLSKF